MQVRASYKLGEWRGRHRHQAGVVQQYTAAVSPRQARQVRQVVNLATVAITEDLVELNRQVEQKVAKYCKTISVPAHLQGPSRP